MSLLLASCTSPSDPNLELSSVGFNAVNDPGATLVQPAGANFAGPVSSESNIASGSGGDAALPDQLAYVPAARPTGAAAAIGEEETPAVEVLPTAPAPAIQAAAAVPPQATPATDTAPQMAADPSPSEPDPASLQPEAAPKQKKSLFASLFSSTPSTGAPLTHQRGGDRASSENPAAPRAIIKQGLPKGTDAAPPPPSSMGAAPTTFIENQPPKAFIENIPAKPVIDLGKPVRDPVVLASYGNSGDNGLPGVRQSALFEIKRKSGLDDDSDVDIHEEDDAPIQLASAAGLARLAPNGLLTQTEDVDVACLKPSLVRVLKSVEQRFGRRLIVTSGYRSRIRNIRARGAKNSLHMFCAAADIQVPGVSKMQLASFLRSMSGRGGVGTYCHTNSVHIDVGPERDWSWRCGRRKKA